MFLIDSLNRSLKKKLILTLLLITILPIFTLGLINYNSEKDLMTEQVFLFNKALANDLGVKIDYYIQKKMNQIDYLASESYLTRDDLLSFQELYQGFELVYLLNQSGVIEAISEGGLEVKSNYYGAPWFQNAISGQNYISNYHYSEFIDKQVIQFAIPIRDNDKIIGVLGAEINLNAIEKIVTDTIEDTENSEVYLIDNTGKPLIYNKEKEATVNSKPFQSLIQFVLLKGKNGVKEYKDEKGVNILGSYKFIEKLGWAIIVQQSSDKAFAEIRRDLWINLIVILGVGVLVALIALKISKSIFNPIDELKKNMKRVSKGDYSKSVNIERQDEIGELVDSFNKLIEQQIDIISDLKDNSNKISATSKNLFKSADKSHNANQNMAEYIEDTVHSIQDIAAINQEISSFSEETTASTQSGKEQIDEAMLQITKVNNCIIQANQASKELAEESKKIREINNLITNITDQINLLSLNATIEAARAGKAGLGFAVVAEEIGALAKETAKATSNINKTVGEVESGIENVLNLVSQGTKEADVGDKIIKEVAQSFEEIATAIEETSLQLQDASLSTQQVSEKSEEVKDSIEDMNVLSKGVSDISFELDEMSDRLKDIINKFKI